MTNRKDNKLDNLERINQETVNSALSEKISYAAQSLRDRRESSFSHLTSVFGSKKVSMITQDNKNAQTLQIDNPSRNTQLNKNLQFSKKRRSQSSIHKQSINNLDSRDI